MLIQIAYFAIATVIALVVAFVGYRLPGASAGKKKRWMLSVGAASVIWIIFVSIWSLGLENYLARRFGGTLTVDLPANAQFLNATWKEESLWVTYFESSNNRCVFKEYSRYGIMEGDVVIKSCNPVGATVSVDRSGEGVK